MCSTTSLLGQTCCSIGDVADQVLLEYSWGWRALGLNPNVNVEVTSLAEVLEDIKAKEQRAAVDAMAAGAGEESAGTSTAIVPYDAAEAAMAVRHSLRTKVAIGDMQADGMQRKEKGKREGREGGREGERERERPALESEASLVLPFAGGQATFDDFEESDADAEDLQGTIECFLDWNRATQKAILGGDKAEGSAAGQEKEEKEGEKEEKDATAGILLVGSIGGLTSTAELRSAPS